MLLIISGPPGLGSVRRASLVWPLMRVFVCEGDPMSNGALALRPLPSSAERRSDHPGFRERSFKQTVNSEIPVS